MSKTLTASLLVLLFLVMAPASAQDTSISLGPQISGFGIGASGSARFGDYLSVSGDVGMFPFSVPDLGIEGIDYSVDPDVFGLMLALNFHPFKSNFSVGAGLLFGKYIADLESVEPIDEVGGRDFDPSEVGTIIGKVENSGTWPAVMIGYRGKGLNFGLGLAFVKDTEVEARATGTRKDEAILLDALDREINDILAEYLFYAVPIFQFGYQFGISSN